MESSLKAMLEAQGAGTPEETLKLRRDAGEAWLVSTPRGTFIALGEAEGRPAALIDVQAEPPTLSERMLGAVLEVRGSELGVSPRQIAALRRLLALARVAPVVAGPARADLVPSRLAPHLDEVSRRFLAHLLDDDELLLAWRETATSVAVPSPVQDLRAPLFLLVTTHRQALVALSAVGEVLIRLLPAAAAVLERGVGRDVLRAGGLEWQAPLLDEKLSLEVASWPALGPEERALAAARVGWRASRGRGDDAMRRQLVWLVTRGSPLGVLTAASLGRRVGLEELPDEAARARALERLVEEERGSARLLTWWRGFDLGLEEGLEVLRALLEGGAAARAWSVELHTGLREAQLEGSHGGFEEVAVDVAYAEHLLEVGLYEDAQVVLEARLLALPSEELQDLLPPDDADLTKGSGGQRFRVRLLELLSDARGRGRKDAQTVHELALLQPLVPARIRALHDVAEGEGKDAARQAVAVLEPGGLAPLDAGTSPSPDGELFPLGKRLLFGSLQHPAAREGHAFDKLQTFLAAVDVPEHAALRSYCERLDAEHTAAWAALSDASLALGVKSVGAFVSRGDKAVGIRAYEGTPSFLVIGGRHLEPSSEFYLHPWELRFAIAAEVCHLRFGHSRVTSHDVWLGAFEKGRFGVGVMLGMLPVLKGVKLIDNIDKLLDRYRKGPLGRVMKGLDLAERTVTKARGKSAPKKRPKEQLVAATHDKLIAAHRVMQLTADRAGLLLAGDLGAAIRAVFKESHEGLAELPVVERHGLAKALSLRGDDGEMLHQELAIRVSSLISFSLSQESRVLRDALTTPRRRRTEPR